MRHALVTGGAGFLGSLLVKRLLDEGWAVSSIDLEPPVVFHPNLESKQGDIRKHEDLREMMDRHRFDAVFHVAALLAHEGASDKELWSSNVDGTRMVAEFARQHGVPQLIYTSTNCLWGRSLGRPVREDDPPDPVETYGKSKWEGERVLQEFTQDLNVVILRCPTIIDEGRLGLLSILFEFIAEGRKVWVVGSGRNRYQFIYAQDLIDAMLRAVEYPHSNVFGIGADHVTTMADTYRYVIEKAGSRSRVAPLPKAPALLAMRIAHILRISPLGPYHYRMIAEDFEFDTTRIQRELAWKPTLSNQEMLSRAYGYYMANRQEIAAREHVSAHRKPARMGVIALLKWMS